MAREAVWHGNTLAIETSVHMEERGYGRLTIRRPTCTRC